MRKAIHVLILVLGFAAPTFELIFRICTDMFFDPMPTFWHIIAVYLISLSIIVVDIIISMEYSRNRNIVAKISIYYAIIFSTAYSVWFLSISWISVLAIIIAGLGLLGLMPFFILYLSVSTWRKWQEWIPEDSPERNEYKIYYPVLMTIPALLFLWWSPIVIKVGENFLDSESVSSRYVGLWIVDNLTGKKELQKRCFESYNIFMGKEVYDTETLKNAYYYIYGYRPELEKPTDEFFARRRWDFDDDRGSTTVGKLQDRLYLSESALDMNIVQDDGYAYCEWTMIFKNKAMFQKEARTAIQLPPNSVVSKASLWIDGEEKEAAFGASSHVKTVYRSIVQRRKDPLLVTMIGPDQVMAQCFPVPAGGEMKIRIGITIPLFDNRIVQTPYIIESNFLNETQMQHNVWVEADNQFVFNLEDNGEYTTRFNTKLSDEDLRKRSAYFLFKPLVEDFVIDQGNVSVRSIPLQTSDKKPVLVIDGSKDILDKLSRLSDYSDQFSEVIVSQPFDYAVWDKKSDLDDFISDQHKYHAGNTMPALLKAVELSLSNGSSVLWIHGSLPVEMRDELALEQLIRRSGSRVKIYTLPLNSYINSIITDLSFMKNIVPVPVMGNIDNDLKRAIAYTELVPPDESLEENEVYLADRFETGKVLTLSGDAQVNHLYRLYLYSQVMHQYDNLENVDEDLINQALITRIVTPSTGAIVLENQQMYQNAQLDPSVGSENIPKIPEPEFYLLLGISLLVLLYFVWKNNLLWHR